jgi:predicted RNase H-like HicB family nuclease
VVPSIDFTIAFDEPDEDGWIVARMPEAPGALSQGRTREEARENVLDALRTLLTPDDERALKSMQSRVQRPNLDGLLEGLMEPVARQARRRVAEAMRVR